MRRTMIIFATTLVIAAIWGITVTSGRIWQKPARPASATMDVMGMMKNAKNLPEEHFDAY
jgi:hypothetical protein